MNNHPGLDGFAEAHFIGQQHARRVAAAHVIGDVELVRDEIRALAAQAAPRHPVLFALVFAGAIAQGKAVHSVNLTSEQAVLRFAEHQFAVEEHFTQRDIFLKRIQTGADINK